MHFSREDVTKKLTATLIRVIDRHVPGAGQRAAQQPILLRIKVSLVGAQQRIDRTAEDIDVPFS